MPPRSPLAPSSRTTTRAVRPIGSRRRGPALENAVLEAAWEELLAVGYRNLTMEGIARRARTSKPVIYRRWPSRVEVVGAALRNRFGSLADPLPDTGSLREDVLSVLRRMARRFTDIPPEARQGLISEALAEASRLERNPAGEVIPRVLRTILQRAAERGEIEDAQIPARVVRLPADLVRHEMVVSDSPVPERVLSEIVDEIFLPLVKRPRPGRTAVRRSGRAGD